MKKRNKIVLRFEIGLTIFLFIIMVLSATIVYLPWYFTSKKNIKNIARQVNEEIMNGINQKVDNLFTQATQELIQIKWIFQQKILDINNKEHREKYFLTVLKKNKPFSWVVLGRPDGFFVGAQREMQGVNELFNIVNRRWINNVEKATKTIDLYNINLKNKSTRIIENEDYNTRTRTWYKAAEQIRQHSWTKVYPFRTTKQPGINVSISLDIDSNFYGITSIAMELNDISNYIKKITPGKTGTVFIINTNQELIAFKDLKEDIFSTKNDKLYLKRLEQFNNNFLKIGYNTLKDHAINLEENKDLVQYLYRDSETSRNYFVAFAPSSFKGWTIGTIIPEDDFLGEIYKNIRNVVIIILCFFVAVAILALLISRNILVKPIHFITQQTTEIKKFNIEEIEAIHTNISEINQLSSSMLHMSKGLKSFKKYLPTEIVQDLIKQGIEVELGGQEKLLSIFFSDIQQFTKTFQKMGNELIPSLSEYFGEMSQIILENNGTIDKFIGDSIMAFWGAPIPNENHAVYACKTAIQCQKILKSLRVGWKRDNIPLFHSRIGINTGTVFVGNIGYEKRFDYTVMGDPVNIASRLESLNKYYGTSTLVGHSTYEEAKHQIIARKVDTVKLYGAYKGLDVYELIDLKDEISIKDKFEWIEAYEEALEYYKIRAWEKAFKIFITIKKLKGADDNPALIFAKRCKFYKQNPPAENWDGTTVMDKK